MNFGRSKTESLWEKWLCDYNERITWLTEAPSNIIILTLFLPGEGGISPYMSVTWPSRLGIGLKHPWKSSRYRAFISINKFYSVLGSLEQSRISGVGGPRIKSHVLLDDERNSQFFSTELWRKYSHPPKIWQNNWHILGVAMSSLVSKRSPS